MREGWDWTFVWSQCIILVHPDHPPVWYELSEITKDCTIPFEEDIE